MAFTLYTEAGNFRAFKILIAAEYNGVELSVPPFNAGEDNVTPEFLANKSPMGKTPVLDTPQGAIFESNAIARYVARMRRDTELYGATMFDSARVDSWVDFCSHQMELPLTMWVYPVLGFAHSNPAAVAQAKEDAKRSLRVLDNHLFDKTYLVGEDVTLADITVVSALVYPMKFVMDAEFRGLFPNVMRWFDTCVNQPQFRAVIGTVALCEAEMQPAGADALPPVPADAEGGKKGKKKKNKGQNQQGGQQQNSNNQEGGGKKKKNKGGDQQQQQQQQQQPKKQEHPLKVLDRESPSPFIGDVWKKIYSNTDNYADAMNQFWDMFDAEGWSLWFCSYNYNAENAVLFMTSNLVSGFVQRTGEIRKWAFGTMQIHGEGPFNVSGLWLIRGQDIGVLLEANPDAEYYTWTKVETPVSDADKARALEMWCSETTVNGEAIKDCKVFK